MKVLKHVWPVYCNPTKAAGQCLVKENFVSRHQQLRQASKTNTFFWFYFIWL